MRAGRERRFSRVDFARARRVQTLSAPGPTSAHVFTIEWRGETWVVKDLCAASRLFRLVVGPILIARELRALEALRGLHGVPADGFRIDSVALAYRYTPGESIRQLKRRGAPPEGSFFVRLEALVENVHERGLVHLDLRNAWNVVATPQHDPLLVDFQTSIGTRFLPRPLRRLLEEVDLSGVYKWWVRSSPATFDDARAARFRKIQSARRFLGPLLAARLRPSVFDTGEAKTLEPVHRVFNNKAARRLLTKLRAPLAIVGAGAACALANPEWLLTALVISAVGALLQLWCFSAIAKQRELAVDGPYKFMRNPMYIARFILILGFVAVLGRPWLVPLYAVVYYFYAVNRVAREERKLIRVFGDAYADYSLKVHRFLPTSSYPGGRLLYGRMDLLLQNHGHWNVLGVAAFYAICYAVAFVPWH